MRRYRVGLGTEGISLWFVTVEARNAVGASFAALKLVPPKQFCDYASGGRLIKKIDYSKYPLTKSMSVVDGNVRVNY